MNNYARLPDVLAELNAEGITNVATHEDVLRSIARASAFVRNETRRIYHTETRTAQLNGSGDGQLWLQTAANEPYRSDLVSVTTLKVDEDGDGVFELTLVHNTDYWLLPANPTVTGQPARGLTLVVGRSTSPQITVWPKRPRCIELVGKFGHSETTEASGLTGTLADATDTTITTTEGADTTGLIYPGDTLLIESEQVYVTAVATTTVTVERGVNGTTAAAHTSQALLIRRYPDDIERAVSAEAARWLWHAAGGYQPELGTTEFSQRWPSIRDTLRRYSAVTVPF